MTGKRERALSWCAVSTRAQVKDDKWSIDVQQNENRTFVEGRGDEIVESLIVPGHSRRYLSLETLAAEAAKKDIDAFDRLIAHFRAKDFDYVVVRDGDRFRRTQSLFARITEEIINIGARIYSHVDGWIDKSNYRMWIAMVGYRASADVDKLVSFRREGMTRRVQRGLPGGSGVPMSHRVVRDEKTGKAVRMELNPDTAGFMRDAATLLLEGVGWWNIERELMDRWGHVNPKTGAAWQPLRYYTLMMNPFIWGNGARWFRQAKDEGGKWGAVGDWIMFPADDLPEGVMIEYDVGVPAYTGELRERLIAEVQRRRHSVHGSARSKDTHKFTGLVNCAECGYSMGYYRYAAEMKCMSHWNQSPTRPDCTQRGTVAESHLIEWIDARLREMVDGDDPVFERRQPDEAAPRLEQMRRQIESSEAQIRALIRHQAAAGDDASDIYSDEIDKASRQLKRARETLVAAEREVATTQGMLKQQQRTLEDLRAMTLEVFWQQENRVINQVLHGLMQDRVIVVLNREVIGTIARPKRWNKK